jgi:hypothetical protein
MGPEWSEQLFAYGEGDSGLGTSPGGDGGLMFGPEYGTQTTDGTWWFLDAAKLRIAHFDGNGTYLDQIPMPPDLLVQGIYFQYQMPQAMDDGSIALSGFDQPLLRIADGTVTGTRVDGSVSWPTTDGTSLFGFAAEDGALIALDPDDPVIQPVDWFLARDGNRYRVTVSGDRVIVELPDGPVAMTRTIEMRYSEDPTVIAHAGIEVETGVDGTLFILFYGAPESDESLGVGGILSISPDGIVSEVEQIADPFSPSDPGSPAHLGITPGSSTPWYMVVGEDGVRVYTRAG